MIAEKNVFLNKYPKVQLYIGGLAPPTLTPSRFHQIEITRLCERHSYTSQTRLLQSANTWNRSLQVLPPTGSTFTSGWKDACFASWLRQFAVWSLAELQGFACIHAETTKLTTKSLVRRCIASVLMTVAIGE